ncbi:ER membrane glycoprotein subunit of the GPI transamidase complex-like protein [Gnomoniopsis smithogilvyi]|uniref:GPI mannosyltransferase 2 n=1 Tax=Gnomoniopsis smithogilvyi TaxID=1191159 RepID=A0A9W8YWQ5_9PEZI|nr:ER membrane glycoprotein subunit of the GPI transamidase complex-like protein [Gnomoniopsis smithogilvyi]
MCAAPPISDHLANKLTSEGAVDDDHPHPPLIMPILKHQSPYWTLTVTFVAWKILLLAIAAGSQVGPLYDTSSSLLTFDPEHGAQTSIRNLVTRLCSWDAIYFIKNAQRGYLFEQEWAFGSALPTCISLVIRALTILGLVDASSNCDGAATAHLAALIGVLITHSCHFLSSLVLYQLGLHIWADSTWALVSALLHVLSPAGLFLSAPYQESPFSLLSFIGWLLLVKSCLNGHGPISRDVLTILAGVSFGLATVFRTNGLLNGVPFAFECLRTLYHLVEDLEPSSSVAHIRRLAVLGLSGLFVAAGSLVPQFFAYRIYCTGRDVAGPQVRPWCLSFVPSIYNFVQKEYWNTGFLRYWTISNAPLFLLAAPMLFIMGKGGKDIFLQAGRIPQSLPSGSNVDSERLRLVVRSMALTQMILVGLALTNYHVQIITRLSSGYPAWYWWVAACLRSPKTRQMGSGFVVFMVVYALIQAVLFASFLPPA